MKNLEMRDPLGDSSLSSLFDATGPSFDKLNLYPDSFEAVAFFDRRSNAARSRQRYEWAEDPIDRRQRKSRSKRALGIARFAVANRSNVMLTLTTGGTAIDRESLKAEVAKVMRHVKDTAYGRAFPYQFVVEGGSEGESVRAHAHVLTSRYATEELARHWALGLTDVVELERAEQIRNMARYLAKAIPTGTGHHEIRRAKGFSVRKEVLNVPPGQHWFDLACKQFGCRPVRSGLNGAYDRAPTSGFAVFEYPELNAALVGAAATTRRGPRTPRTRPLAVSQDVYDLATRGVSRFPSVCTRS